jgi:hypothetical protein
MVAVREIPWEEASAPGFEQTTRHVWREAVAEVAEKARTKLPECSGRVDSAVKLVLAGDVELLADGSATVASQSSGTATYHVANGVRPCKDFSKAPHGFCKHRLGAAIARRAQELVKAQLAGATKGQPEASSQPPPATAAEQSPLAEPVETPQGVAVRPEAPLPEAPVSITLKATLHGHEVLVTLRGVDFASVKAQVEDASQWLQAQHGQTTDETPQCPTHGAMKRSTKGKGWYCPHKLADGSWCKGK